VFSEKEIGMASTSAACLFGLTGHVLGIMQPCSAASSMLHVPLWLNSGL
jgi:hypothetical protein